MQPKTFMPLLCFFLALQSSAQITPASFSQLQIKSAVYDAPFNVYVFEPEKKTPGEALPVIYIPNVAGTASDLSVTINNLQAKGFLPRSIIVGIGHPAATPVKFASLVSSSGIDAKGLFNETVFLDEEYYQFIRTEVMPGIEQAYKTSAGVLCADDTGSFMNYVLNNHAGTFAAYMSCSPFVWFDGTNTLSLAKTYFSAFAKERTNQGSMDDVYISDEALIKDGRHPHYRH